MCEGSMKIRHSIAFGKAPRREAHSQASRQAYRQAETHSLAFFFPVADYILKQWGTQATAEQLAIEW